MAHDVKKNFLEKLAQLSGPVKKLPNTQSLYEVGKGAALIYIRYSKLHPRNQTFYGLRKKDLQLLEGRPAVISFLWDGQVEPLVIPFSEYEEIFRSVEPADDGQYKAQVYLEEQGVELYIAKAGRFNVESHIGWDAIHAVVHSDKLEKMPELSHQQVQTLLGAIGVAKGFDVWVPQIDRNKLDWKIAERFACRESAPLGFPSIERVLEEVDVIWIRRGSSDARALFEVEHSTPIYSGLLRLNDIHLVAPDLNRRFSIVANDTRRALFARQLNRPTFKTSGLVDLCTFLEYYDVFGWYQRIKSIQGGRI